MSNIFANLKTDGFEEEQDRLGGGGVLESDAHDAIVKLAYAGKAQHSDAQSVTVHFDINGFEYRETYWVTNRNGENFYLDKRDSSKKHALPGYNMVDNLCLLTTGYGLADQEMEEKVVNLYDFEEKKELPKNVMVLTSLIGKPITVGLIKQIVDKTAKDSAGNYVPTGETREENTTDKFFHAETKRTVSEIKAKLEEAGFYPKWVEKNQGKVRNRAKGADGKAVGGGAPKPSGNTTPQKSLFG